MWRYFDAWYILEKFCNEIILILVKFHFKFRSLGSHIHSYSLLWSTIYMFSHSTVVNLCCDQLDEANQCVILHVRDGFHGPHVLQGSSWGCTSIHFSEWFAMQFPSQSYVRMHLWAKATTLISKCIIQCVILPLKMMSIFLQKYILTRPWLLIMLFWLMIPFIILISSAKIF